MNIVNEFDYELWTTEDTQGKHYWARIKATGEVTELSHEVMKCLRSEEKKMWREIEARKDGNGDLFLDVQPNDKTGEAWLEDRHNPFNKLLVDLDVNDFCELLSPVELAVFRECMLGGKQKSVFAHEHSISKQSVQTMTGRIRKKAKKFF